MSFISSIVYYFINKKISPIDSVGCPDIPIFIQTLDKSALQLGRNIDAIAELLTPTPETTNQLFSDLSL